MQRNVTSKVQEYKSKGTSHKTGGRYDSSNAASTAPKVINTMMTIRNPTCVSSPGYAMVDSTMPRTTVAVVTAIVVSQTNGFAHYIVAKTETEKQILT